MSTPLDSLTMDSAVCHGKPVVPALRYPATMVFELMNAGMIHDEILADYPALERDDLLAVLE